MCGGGGATHAAVVEVVHHARRVRAAAVARLQQVQCALDSRREEKIS
jgi:hypothetical protein